MYMYRVHDNFVQICLIKYNKIFHIKLVNPPMSTLSILEKIVALLNQQICHIIIQQIVTLSKYGHDALDICHP